ncbi:MAG: UDP-3-O-acyl-N-acetylglucosamine deacetylase [Myxococcota bacterium]
MIRARQCTLRHGIDIEGLGLHSGAKVRMSLIPAAPDTGIVFVRTDVSPAATIPARVENVVDTSLATRLGARMEDGQLVRVDTVEHLMAALYGLGIDNLRIEMRGPEVPVMDGSSAPFVRLMQAAGLRSQNAGKRMMIIRRPIEVRDGDRLARLTPSRSMRVSCMVDFDHPLIRDQKIEVDVSPSSFQRELSSARTFGFLKDVERLKAAGLALGGSLENAVVIDDFSVLNAGGLRFPDEFARHKALDAIGDLALFGMPVLGHLTAVRSGHALANELARSVLQEPRSFEVVELEPVEAEYERLDEALPAYGLADAAA